MGFNLENAPAGCAGTNGNYGFSRFAAGNGPLQMSADGRY
jgi:hypothetical protein